MSEQSAKSAEPAGSDPVMRAFVAGWMAHARNPKEAPLLVEDAWHAYRLIESATDDH